MEMEVVVVVVAKLTKDARVPESYRQDCSANIEMVGKGTYYCTN